MIPFGRGSGARGSDARVPWTLTARFTKAESALLCDLALQLIEMLGDRAEGGSGAADALYAQLGIGGSSALPSDPALARLLPDAYRGDDEAASDHRRLTERGLVDRKVANARVVIDSLGEREVQLGEDAVQAWLRTLTDLRLTIAARLQIEEDGDEGVGDDAMLVVYDWLGYLQASLVECLDRSDHHSDFPGA